MKAVILAAERGVGLLSRHPKCLIRFNNSHETILDHQIESLRLAGVTEIGIVVGHEMDQIVDHVRRYYAPKLGQFRFIVNPCFEETGDLDSLWLAREWLKGESFLCLKSDVVFYTRLLPAIRSAAPVTMVVDPEWQDTPNHIGITAFSAAVSARFFRKIRAVIQAGRRAEAIHVVLQELADEGLPVERVPTSGLPWAKIQDPGDLAFARLYVFPKLASLEAA